MTNETEGWIGVDLDGTLAEYDTDTWAPYHIGAPIPAMVERVKGWLARGQRVKVLTARMSDARLAPATQQVIAEWTRKHVGVALEATCVKDYDMLELWDDRAVRVEANTGRRLSPSLMEG